MIPVVVVDLVVVVVMIPVVVVDLVVVLVVVVVVMVVVVVVVISELLYEDLAQQPGQLLSVCVGGVRVPGVRVLADAKEEGIRGGEDDQKWDEELHFKT